MAHLLEVDALTIRIDTAAGPLYPVRDVSFAIAEGETLGLVGESGCGKTLTCLAVMGLLGKNVAIERGDIRVSGRTLTGAGAGAQGGRRREIGVIFQNPLSCLNPVRTVGWQVGEAYRLRTGSDAATARREATALLEWVGIPEPASRARDYPHQLSGGMNQRVMIAMAIAGGPKLLIADEPTTALDVTIQAQILELLGELQRDLGMGVLFVTHDLGLVADIADRMAVMYAGRIVEIGLAGAMFARPRHPYAAGLIACLPWIDEDVDRLPPIEGRVPALGEMPPGCAFAPRCALAAPDCASGPPPLEGGVACVRPLDAPHAAPTPRRADPAHV